MKKLIVPCAMVVVLGTVSSYGAMTIGGNTIGLAVEGFESLSGNPFATVSNQSLGTTFGEMFTGQTDSPSGNYDVVTGTPTSTVSMDTSAGADHRVIVPYGAWSGENATARLGP